MRIRTAVIAAVVAGLSVASVADAAPPKNFKKTVTFTDGTPDPSGNASSGNENHCSGKLPQEAPIEVKIPGPGYLEVSIGGFQGDWALQVRDKSGEVLAGADVNPPSEFESVSVKFKKAETVGILPCNMSGTPQAEVTYSYTYKKK
ncbi:MAG: hypothetical protein QOE05_2376 [Actinomycetota bacterium]|jgi:hypothetical protein|nr:hypothetical protein [Actinomycetota bacterium]